MTLFRKLVLSILKKFKFLPPPVYLKYYYEYYNGKKLDLDNPVDINEKITWLKAYYKPDILTKLVDKYEVREYVKEKIGEEYLNQLFAVYTRVKDVNFNKLPNQFVLKAAHGYNFNIIVPDKRELNFHKAKLQMTKWMNRNQYYRGGLEWAYKNVPPKIVAEKYLPELDKKGISDYKFFCFNGKPKYITIIGEKDSEEFRCNYDLQWNKLEFGRQNAPIYQEDLPKPKNFEEMIRIATTLSENFPFIRVDLYNIDGRILFGELTFYPADGRQRYTPDKYNRIIGDYLQLPEIPERQREIKGI